MKDAAYCMRGAAGLLVLCGWLEAAEYEPVPVVVTAPPLVSEVEVTRFGGSAAVVSRAQIDGMGAQDLQSALRRIPGVNISRYNLLGAFGGADGGAVYIRGRGTSRPGSDIVIYSDGVPRKVGVWDHPLMDVAVIDHADHITVYKGPQPVYNSGVFGSVEIESRQRRRRGYVSEAEVSAGTYDTVASRLHHGGRTEAFDYYAGFSHRESNGHRPHSGATLQSLYGRIGGAIGDVISLSALISATDNKVDDPGAAGMPVPVRDRFATRSVTTSIRMDNRHEGVGGFVLVYHEDGQIRWDKDRVGGPGTPPGASNTDWENYGFRVWQTLAWEPFNFHAGVDGASEGGKSENRTVAGMVPFAFKGRYETLMPGAAVDVALGSGEPGAWSFQPSAGLRGNVHSEFDYKLAPHAGLVARKTGVTLYASAARGVNYPGVYAAGIAAPVLEHMEAETLDRFEVGANVNSKKEGIIFGISCFRDQTANLLQWTPQGLMNAGSADVDGVEVSVALNPHDQLALYASVTWLDPENPKTPRVPDWSASAGVALSLTHRMQLHADIDAVSRQYAFNGRDGEATRAEAEKIDRYAVGNVRVSYSPVMMESGRLTLFAGCENVGDVKYETLAGYPLPGRIFNAGARILL